LNQKIPVTRETPLPIQSVKNAETLLVSSIGVQTTARDLLNSTNAEAPTLDSCQQYTRLIWMARKDGTADVSYTVLGRATDPSGMPLGDGWHTIATGTLTGAANTWHRVEITQGHWDQYRIQVSQSAGSQLLVSKVVGVR